MTQSIKHWTDDEKPREKLITHGASSLSVSELMAIILGSGTRELSAVALAKKILEKNQNSLLRLSKLSVKELCQNKGIGPAKAVSLMACFELANRKLDEQDMVLKRKKISSSYQIYSLFRKYLLHLPHEEVWAAFLTPSNRVLGVENIAKGGLNGVAFDSRSILKHALLYDASAIILAHNHPSGNKKISNGDVTATMRVKKALDLLNIRILDHIIICDQDYLSFVDEGILEPTKSTAYEK